MVADCALEFAAMYKVEFVMVVPVGFEIIDFEAAIWWDPIMWSALGLE
jgi:hypothetical protein